MPDTDDIEALKRKLAALEEEFEDFAYIVSHDLSGPLRHAAGFSEMVLANDKNILDEKSKRHLNHIRNSALKGREALELLRDYSRLNTRPFILADDVDCEAIIDSVKEALSADIEASKAMIRADNLPKIRGDITKITTLFHALIKNAVVYCDKSRTPLVDISCEDTPGFWHFKVKDNGFGIPQNQQGDVMRVFRRAVDAEDYPGDGMGLAYAKKVAEKHNGRLWIGDSSGQGTCIEFTLAKSL